MTDFRAITVRAPYSWAIAIGAKRVENRTAGVVWRGDIAIHSGAALHRDGGRDSRIVQLLNMHGEQECPRGAIVAVAELVGCHQAAQPDDPADTCCGPWGMRTYSGKPAWHLLFDNIRRLPVPVPCRGWLQVGWRVPAEAEAAVYGQVDGVTTFSHTPA